MSETIFCTNCGHRLFVNQRFCSRCGTPNKSTATLSSFETRTTESVTPAPIAGRNPLYTLAPTASFSYPASASLRSWRRRKRRKRRLLLIVCVPILFTIYLLGTSWAHLQPRGPVAITVWFVAWFVSLLVSSSLIGIYSWWLDSVFIVDFDDGWPIIAPVLFLLAVMLFIAPYWVYPLMASQISGIVQQTLGSAPNGITWFVSVMTQPVTVAVTTAISFFLGTTVSIKQLLESKDKDESRLGRKSGSL